MPVPTTNLPWKAPRKQGYAIQVLSNISDEWITMVEGLDLDEFNKEWPKHIKALGTGKRKIRAILIEWIVTIRDEFQNE